MRDPSGLSCRAEPNGATAAKADDGGRRDAATSNVTDLRRARQRARAVVRDVRDAIRTWIETNAVTSTLTTSSGVREANRAITAIASERFRDDLVAWLVERNRITAGRAARAAFDAMTAADDRISDDDLQGKAEFDRRLDGETLRQVRQVDAGLLYDTELAEQKGLNEPLAEELGDDITRQLRLGVANDESVQDLAERVDMVLTDGDADERQEHGVTGHTKRTKAELIAHDSVQDAYNQAARGRYLRNGFRYGVYDATIDFKTSDLCRRMDEHVVDMRDDPFLIPPLHPWCRSGIRPVLDVEGRSVLSREDIADGFLQTIMSTKSYRPPANAAGSFQPTSITRELGQAD